MKSVSQLRRMIAAVGMLAVALALFATEGTAQSGKQSPGLFKGLTQGRQDPVKIMAARLEVRDKDKKATFSDNVHVIQGDTEVRADTLIVFYESEIAQGTPQGGTKQGGSGQSGAMGQGQGGNQQIRRMEAKGSVRVTQADQRASGDRAEFDMRKNMVSLTGNVVVARGDDVLRGQALFADLTTGVSRMESRGGRVEGMFKPSPGQAQPEKQVPGHFKGLTHNQQEPVRISAVTLEVRDKKKTATFNGNVQVVQGDTEVRCNTLVVFYESEASKGGSKGQAAAADNQQLRRMEARGAVTIIQKDQRASGDRGDFDMRRNTVTLSGNVVLSRGDDVLRAQLLVVDLTTGTSRMESGGGRVEGIIKAAPGQVQPNLGKQN